MFEKNSASRVRRERDCRRITKSAVRLSLEDATLSVSVAVVAGVRRHVSECASGPIWSRQPETLSLMPQETPRLPAPRNRGKFSDRSTWGAVHEGPSSSLCRRRAYRRQLPIARHGVKRRTVHHSIQKYLAQMPANEANAIRAERWKRTQTGRYRWEWIFRELRRLQRQQTRLWRMLASVSIG